MRKWWGVNDVEDVWAVWVKKRGTHCLVVQRITLHKQRTIPLYPPTTTVVFARHPRVQDQLHNWRKLHRTWQPQHPPPCTCKQLHNKHPNHIYNDHMVLPLHKFTPDQHFLQYSGRSTFFSIRKQAQANIAPRFAAMAQTTPPPQTNIARQRHHSIHRASAPTTQPTGHGELAFFQRCADGFCC